MSTTQYTIRAIPKKLDDFLRQQARLTGKSLNKVVLEYLEQSTKLDLEAREDNFAWIIGANALEDKSLAAIEELKRADKTKQRR